MTDDNRDNFRIETSRLADVPSLAAFLREEYPDGDIANNEYLKWEYVENPSGRAYLAIAKNDEGIMAAQYALIPQEVIWGDNSFKASLSLNTLTSKKFRGKGLFVRTAEANFDACAADDVLFTVGIPNANSYPGFIEKLNFLHCGNLTFSFLPLRPINTLKTILNRGSKKKGQEILTAPDGPELARHAVSYFDPETDRRLYEPFLMKWKSEARIHINRGKEFLDWRYLKHPSRKYQLLKYVVKGEMQALAVYRTLEVFGMRTCIVMDLLSLNASSGKELLNVIAVGMKRAGIDAMIAAYAGKCSIHEVLKSAGFFQIPKFLLPQQLPFILRIHKDFEKSDQFGDLDNWHFTFGDYDIF